MDPGTSGHAGGDTRGNAALYTDSERALLNIRFRNHDPAITAVTTVSGKTGKAQDGAPVMQRVCESFEK